MLNIVNVSFIRSSETSILILKRGDKKLPFAHFNVTFAKLHESCHFKIQKSLPFLKYIRRNPTCLWQLLSTDFEKKYVRAGRIIYKSIRKSHTDRNAERLWNRQTNKQRFCHEPYKHLNMPLYALPRGPSEQGFKHHDHLVYYCGLISMIFVEV